ncbi:Hypothetical_protein [Hexamita inflata]|uniref:Hypothetical_protein n=1 Tax=Hexamita inflata TaxID=28002 RepID=A0AA86N812_9EUKA|nr:Hypothetical protein HINF_LOCUS2140 [Hexamita inflata]
MKIAELNIYDSQLNSSQLVKAQINKLNLENYFDEDYYYNVPLITIIDDIPNVEYLNLYECIINLFTFSSPKINKFYYYGSKRISFTFFKNIQTIQVNQEPEYLKEFQKAVQKSQAISGSQQLIIENQRQLKSSHNEIIHYSTKQLEDTTKLLQSFLCHKVVYGIE